MIILALDYGDVHTGAAVSDPTGNIVRPLAVIREAGSDDGISDIAGLVEDEGVQQVIVGLPVTLKGVRGEQAALTEEFISRLAGSLDIPVKAWDERFTSKLASARGRHTDTPEHSLAACVLLESYLASREYEAEVGDTG